MLIYLSGLLFRNNRSFYTPNESLVWNIMLMWNFRYMFGFVSCFFVCIVLVIAFYINRLYTINPFLANIPILYPLKTTENSTFSVVFRGYKMGTLARNRIILRNILILRYSSNIFWKIQSMCSSEGSKLKIQT